MAPEPGAQFEPGRRLVRAQRVVRIWPCTESGNAVVGVPALVVTPSAPQRAATVTEQRAVTPAAQVRPLPTPMRHHHGLRDFRGRRCRPVGVLGGRRPDAGDQPAGEGPPTSAAPADVITTPRVIARSRPSVDTAVGNSDDPVGAASNTHGSMSPKSRNRPSRRAAGTEQLIADQTLRRSRSLANSPVTTSTAMVWP